MATVYKAYDTRLERDVAIKVIRTDLFGPTVLERLLKRFEREARALAKMEHSNIVAIYDFGEYEGAPFLVMQYLPGGTLKHTAKKPMPFAEAAHLLIPIARALEFAHKEGIVHRDIKPANILITKNNEPMLSDFGIAKMLEEQGTTQLTGTGMGIGTPEYMAPEQWKGEVMPETDIYALGVVFYELVTGRKPYSADTPAAVFEQMMLDPLPRPKELVPDLPDVVEKVLFKALAKKPEDRFTDMGEFARFLEKMAFSDTETGLDRPDGMAEDEPTESATVDAVLLSGEEIPRRGISSGLLIGLSVLVLVVVLIIVLALTGVFGGGSVEETEALVEDLSATGVAVGLADGTDPAPTEIPLLSSTLIHTLPPTFTQTPPLDNTPTAGLNIVSTMISSEDGMVLVYVPEGEFEMGSEDGEDHESPIHTVFLDAFWIDQTEVTNIQYAMCVDTGACEEPYQTHSVTRLRYYGNTEYNDYPVIAVNWSRAAAYCAWAGRRLPTEAEWEKAARGTDQRLYAWGDSIDCSLANYWGKDGGCIGDTVQVGAYPDGASPYGALDIIGNVWEWVADRYDENYYSNSPSENPQGPSSGNLHVMRGGSYILNWVYVRSTVRFGESPSRSQFDHEYGFRCAATP